jgi:acid phosphatase type 7
MVARDLATSGAMRVLDAGFSPLAYGFQTARTSSNGGRVRLQLSVTATAVGVLLLLPLSSAAGRAASAPTPIKAAFYYPWFPETWTVNGHRTHYAPDLGYYRTASTKVEDRHIAALTYAGVNAAISSWHGPGHYTDVRLASLLARTVARHSPLKWAVYDEHDPAASVSGLVADLKYIRDHLAKSPAYLRVGGKFVVFVYNDIPGCATAASWASANAQIGNTAYVDLKIFPGYRSCPKQPSGWHQYAPAVSVSRADQYAVSVSPGFWRADEATPRLQRDPARFTADVRAMIASHARWQLVTTFNEWGEGTAVEGARQWQSSSGYGQYLDILHRLFRGSAAEASVEPKAALPKPKPKPKPPKPAVVKGAVGKGIVGAVRVSGALTARPARRGAWSRARYHWLVCSWTGDGCTQAGKSAVYHVRAADLGHVIRLLVTPKPGAGTLRFGPTSVVLPATGPPSIVAAGDIACDPTSSSFRNGVGTSKSCKQMAVSSLAIRLRPTAVLTLGDTAYECGDAISYTQSFGPSWGRMKAIIHPAIGNHEYGNACHRNDASPYFAYFGAAAGTKGWYSYDVGTWHFIVLNSECHYGGSSSSPTQVGGCDASSPQAAWLRHDLATHHATCTLAYWHEPRFSSGEHGDALQMGYLWNLLAGAHVDVVLSGHNHDWERFDPIGATPESQNQPNLDPNGIREFVVGTGGRNVYPITAAPLQGEPFRNDTNFGVLSLSLQPAGYRWQFHSIATSQVLDEGSGACH